MSDQLDRPARPARRPRPAADAGVDPIDYRPAPASDAPVPLPASTPERERAGRAPAPAAGAATRDITVQLNTRISIAVADTFDAAASQFPTKRAALEHAILTTFGS